MLQNAKTTDVSAIEVMPLRPDTKSHAEPRSTHTAIAHLGLLLTAAVLAFAVLGYHPYAEDGGIYTAAVAARMNPELFVHDHAWVTGHTRFSLFVPLVAATLRGFHLTLANGLLLVQAISVTATVAAVLLLARCCFRSRAAVGWVTVLVAAAAGLPIAGTSLYLIDPYVTARSLTTPLLLLALAACLAHRWGRGTLLWVAALALHPLMALWGGLPLCLLWIMRRHTSGKQTRFALRGPMFLLCGLLALTGVAWLFSPPAGAAALEVARTRGYWFLSQWRWFEVAGAIVPLVLLVGALRRPGLRRGWTPAASQAALALVLSASTGMLLALLFVHAGGSVLTIARTQPMRTLHLFYAMFLLLLGGTIADRATTAGRALLLGGILLVVTITMVFTQRNLYAASGRVEFPGQASCNGWVQAFLWAREHTPTDALFALDADYTTVAGEDAQGFRAIALRSVLPDRAKDAGIAAVVPSLTAAWKMGSDAQIALNVETDAERRTRLLPLGVGWLVLPADAVTTMPCDYRNSVAKICRLR